MDTLICAGASGARVMDAVLHLCAMGLGPARLRLLVIDPDAANGNIDDTRELVRRYQKLHEDLGDGPFFRTKLELLGRGENQGLQVWSPVRAGEKFRRVLNWESLNDAQRAVLHLLYTERELDMEMKVGFQGHPALGAAAMSLLPLYQNSPVEEPLLAELKGAFNNEVTSETARVMVAGSIFGGTGASTLHPLVRHFRSDDFLKGNRSKLRIGAVALTPYFQFDRDGQQVADAKDDDEGAVRSQDFPLACRSAAEYYEHLRNTNEWDFDAMYWVGDDAPTKVPYAKGGPKQRNPAHFVDLLAALACLDFFSNMPVDTHCRYAGPQERTDLPGKNVVTWQDLPINDPIYGRDRAAIKHAVHVFQMMAISHLGFFGPLLGDVQLSSKAYCVPWYVDRFMGADGGLTSEASKLQIARLTEYLVKNYLPWWGEIFGAEPGRIHLLNRSAWVDPKDVDVTRLGNLAAPDGASNGFDAIDHMFDEMVRAAATSPTGKNPSSVYLQMLHQAADKLAAKLTRNETTMLGTTGR